MLVAPLQLHYTRRSEAPGDVAWNDSTGRYRGGFLARLAIDEFVLHDDLAWQLVHVPE